MTEQCQNRSSSLRFCGAGRSFSPFMQADAGRSDNYVRFLAWSQANQQRLILWGTIAALAIAAIIFFVYYQGQKEIRASQALSSVPVPLSPGQPVRPGTADAYLKVAREHNGTKAGARALLLGAATLFTDGKYIDAQKIFEQFLREYPESQWVAQAHYGIASSLDAQGKVAEATAKFEEIRRRFANDALIDEVKLALGRLYENQNKPEEAHKLYTELVQANPYTGIGSEAGVRKEDLEAKFPHLEATNAPILQPPQLTSLTNRPATTNRTITITNVTPRTATNVGPAKPGTNVPLILKPQTAPPPASQAPPSQPGPVPPK
jgi:tetratricopeptide (TPR) repeat protein